MIVKISELTQTHGRRLSKNEFKKLKASIEREGIREPIEFIRFRREKYIVNGHHRVMIARQLGMEEVPAREVEMPHKGYRTADDLIDTDMR